MIKKENVKILIADDSSFMRKILIGYLKEGGFSNIVEVGNGEKAIEAYKKDKPDVILLDLIMPVKDGSVVLDELIKMGANVIVVSAMGQSKIIKRMLAKGAKGYFVKPFFSTEEIEEKINDVVNGE